MIPRPASAASAHRCEHRRITRRPRRRIAIALAGIVPALCATAVAAVGLGQVTQQSALSQPLRIVVPLIAEAGEELAAECFKLVPAERDPDGVPQVTFGRVALERTASGAQLVISHPRPINDPVVRLTLQAGCETPVRREFTLLMDLPAIDVPQVAAESAPAGDVVAPPRSPTAREPGRSAGAARAAAPGTTDGARSPRKGPPPKARGAARGTAKRPPAASAEQPRLRLSSAPPPLPGTAPSAAEGAQPRTEQELANAMEAETVVLRQRIAELSAMVERLQQEMRANEAADRAAEEAKKAPPPPPPVPWWEANWPALAMILGMALLIALVLLWKRRQDAAARRADWQATGVGPSRTDSMADLRKAAPLKSAPAGIVRSDVERGAATMTRSPLPPPVSRGAASALAVSELSHVTEEARVYVALGHPDRAIDVLNEHLKRLPRSIPAAWLMLLDLYHATGRRQEFRRLAEEFHLQCNVQTPLWEGFAVDELGDGGLEAFPHIVKQIVGLWGQPACHAYLERLLYDNRDGRRMGFPLAAYSDILLLMQIGDVPPAIDIDTDLANEGKLGPRTVTMAGAPPKARAPATADPARPRKPMPPASGTTPNATPSPISFELDLDADARGPGKKPA